MFLIEVQNDSDPDLNLGLYSVSVDEGQNPETDEGHNPETDDGINWLRILLIGVGVAALIGIVIVLPVIKGYCQKRRNLHKL